LNNSRYSDILVEDEGPVRTIYFNRERDMNRILVTTLEELHDSLKEVENSERVRVVVITGKGKSFAAGVSLDEIQGRSVNEARQLSHMGHEICSLLEEMGAISVAAINGFAFGGGSELALACDIRIGSDKMRIGQPEVSLGIMPGFGATQRLSRIVGYGVAMDLILSGEIINARRALEIGLVSRLFPFNEFEDERVKFVDKLVRNAPLAQRLAKKAIRFHTIQTRESGLDEEARLFSQSFETDEPEIGIRAFQEKTKPEWP
jgi:enoyl-CoA hydratase